MSHFIKDYIIKISSSNKLFNYILFLSVFVSLHLSLSLSPSISFPLSPPISFPSPSSLPPAAKYQVLLLLIDEITYTPVKMTVPRNSKTALAIHYTGVHIIRS